MTMDENEFNSMLNRAQQKKAEQRELFQAQSQRREQLLAKALRSNRVVPNFVETTEQSESDLRTFFNSDMQRLMRRHLGEQVGSGNDQDENQG